MARKIHSCHVDEGFDPGLAWLILSLPSQGDLHAAEKAFNTEIERLQREGVTATELSQARNQALADFWRELATIDGKADTLGSYAVLKGGYQKLFAAPRAYEQVTAEDIRKLATELLRPGNRTVGISTAPVTKEGA